MMIELTRNKFAYSDDACYWLVKYKWFANKGREHTPNWYAMTTIRECDGTKHAVLMHRMIIEFILGRPLVKNEYVDHINHDGLDNHQSNLRLATRSENQHNQQVRYSKKSSIYKGVCWSKKSTKWKAYIKIDNKQIYLGLYDSQFDAALAYDDAAKLYYDKYACLNFPDRVDDILRF